MAPAKTQQKISGPASVRNRHRYRIAGYLSTAHKNGINTLHAFREALLGQPWIRSFVTSGHVQTA